MRVLLFDPRRYRSFRPSTAPLGLLSIATYLNKNGHEAVICDRSHTKEKTEKIIGDNKPDIIGVSVITYSAIKDALEIAACAKKAGVIVVFGGAVATSLSEKFLENKNIDYISLGEGEETWLEIAEALADKRSLEEIRGLAFSKNGKYFKTPEREFTDLTKLPKLDWTLINPTDFLLSGFGGNKQANIYYSKGCTSDCSFCYNNEFHDCKRRCRNLDDVADEMNYLIDTYGVDSFNFTDDLMFYSEGQATAIADTFIKKGIHNKCHWIGEIRIGVLKKREIFSLLYKAGCRNLIFGVETASADMQKVLNKRIRSETVEKTVETCADSGITPLLTFMIGLPGETEDDIRKTVELVKKLDRAICCIQLYTPTPGTRIYDQMVTEGKIRKDKTIEQFSKIVFGEKLYENITSVSKKDIHIVYRYLKLKEFTYKDQNSGDEQILKVIGNVLRSMSGKGIVFFFAAGFKNAKNLIQLMSFFLHPRIRKKYGLYFRKNKN